MFILLKNHAFTILEKVTFEVLIPVDKKIRFFFLQNYGITVNKRGRAYILQSNYESNT